MQFRTIACTSVLICGFAALIPAGFSQNSQIQALPAPGGPAASANPFPPADPRSFSAPTPTKETINDFLKASWGYDPNRIWQVQAVLKTPVAGVSQVIVLVAEKNAPKQQMGQLVFFVLPDGKNIIADNNVLPFGSKPFEDVRLLFQREATGPARGAASKELEFVEFADFECPHCKDAQSTIAKLLGDYPSAHFVYQNFPLVEIHSEAQKAAAYGVCIAKTEGNASFFKFADAVFDNQIGLTPESSDKTLKDAVTKAGGDPEKISACAATAETKMAVDASVNLANQVGVMETPTIFVNGRRLPSLEGTPYETLRQIIDFQANLDGLKLPPSPAAPPAAPSLK